MPMQPLSNIPVGQLPYPLVIKPAWEGSSKGIRNRCFVRGQDEVADVIAFLRQSQPQTILLEEYIAGDEVTVGLYGNGTPSILGMMQIAPVQKSDHFIYSLELKRDYHETMTFTAPPRLPGEAIEALDAPRTAFAYSAAAMWPASISA